MEELIPVINKLQDVFSTVDADILQLPQITVVGSQSSGKSSVLENLVGRDFLPRGTGIVTRRPLVLQLVHHTTQQGGPASEWGEFLHKPGAVFTDFNAIRDEISKETSRLTGNNKGISHTPINLKLFSPHVLDLTLVDLPGITKIAVGDQPEDIESQINALIESYTSNPNCIILAVTAANTDIANSDALKLAKRVDPKGNRTIGVCTKLDLMDAGTDAMDMLTGKVVPIKLGFIGVVNRSQADINQNISIQTARESEQEYFRTHPIYNKIQARSGTEYLSKTLNRLLLHHIRDCLPALRQRVHTLLSEKQTEMLAFGDAYLENVDKGALLLQLLTRFSAAFSQIIDGTYRDLATTELSGGARVCYIFHDTFGATLDAVDALDGLSISDIRTAMRNATGARRALFVPEVCFELLVKKQIERLEEPSLRCVELVFEELSRIVLQCENINDLLRFDELKKEIGNVVTGLMRSRLSPTQTMIKSLIGMELAYINTNHPDFVGGQEAVTRIMEKRNHSTRGHNPVPNSTTADQIPIPGRPTSGGSGDISSIHADQNSSHHSHMREGQEYPSYEPDLVPSLGSTQMSNGLPNGLSRPPNDSNLPVMAGDRSNSKTGLFSGWLFGKKANEEDEEAGPKQVHSSDELLDTPFHDEFESLSTRDRIETELIQSLIHSYFDVVRRNIQDSVPKAIMHLLVNYVKDKLQSHLVSQLYRRENFEMLLSESVEVTTKRKETAEMIQALKRANTALNQVRDTPLL
eukprot:CFRG2477T1